MFYVQVSYLNFLHTMWAAHTHAHAHKHIMHICLDGCAVLLGHQWVVLWKSGLMFLKICFFLFQGRFPNSFSSFYFYGCKEQRFKLSSLMIFQSSAEWSQMEGKPNKLALGGTGRSDPGGALGLQLHVSEICSSLGLSPDLGTLQMSAFLLYHLISQPHILLLSLPPISVSS